MTFNRDAGTSDNRRDNRIVWLDQLSSSRVRNQGGVPSLCDFLRHGTWNAQQRRDGMLGRLDFSRPERYQEFLRGEAEALFPLEGTLRRCGIEDVLPNWREHARTAALSSDLLALDITCDPLPAPHLNGPPELFGVCYALESMRVGARIVLSNLACQKQSAAMAATSYLRSGTQRRLGSSVIESLEAHPDGHAYPGRVLHAAQMAFGMFESAHGPAMNPSFADAERSTYSN